MHLSFYDLTFKDTDSLHLVIFISLLLAIMWQIASFILHIVGRCRGNTYKYLNPNVTRTLHILGALLLFALVVATAGNAASIWLFSVKLHTGAFVSLALISALTVTKITSACMLKWRKS